MSSTGFITQQIIIYGGITIIITGLIGNIFNLVVFLSLRTFREISSSFYLVMMSIFSITQLCLTVLSRVLVGINSSDGTNMSMFWCKCRNFLSHLFQILLLICFCLVTIDQYCATCPYQHFRKFCQIKIAQRLVLLFVFICFLHGIPYLIFYNLSISITGQVSCIITNPIYTQYRTYVILVGLVGFLPIIITIIFGSMAFYNVQQLTYYTVPLVRRELDKQLTSMILIQVLINLFLLSPVVIISVLLLNLDLFRDLNVKAQIQFSFNIAIILYYIHLCVSNRICFFFFFYFIKRLF